jgi:hypothetical protein
LKLLGIYIGVLLLLTNLIPLNNQNNQIKPEPYQLVALASYKQSEYAPVVYHNMQVASYMINQYFQSNSLDLDHLFSYLGAMNNFHDLDCTAPFTIRGAGACEIATLVFRAIENYNGIDLSITRDKLGNDTINGLFISMVKFDHNQISGNFPRDKIAVFYNSPVDVWNRDLKLSLINGVYLKDYKDLWLKIFIREDVNKNFVARVYSNYDQFEIYQNRGDK